LELIKAAISTNKMVKIATLVWDCICSCIGVSSSRLWILRRRCCCSCCHCCWLYKPVSLQHHTLTHACRHTLLSVCWCVCEWNVFTRRPKAAAKTNQQQQKQQQQQ